MFVARPLGLASRALFSFWLVAPLALLAGCNQRRDTGVVVVSSIGGAPMLVDSATATPGGSSRLLLDSVAQGLVRFDAAGQIAPGLAERWIVIDNGMSYIFRLRDTAWDDGSPVTAGQVVKRLRRLLAPQSRNPLRAHLTAIDEIVEMTPQVIEIRLKQPRPDLLKLFAQPEFALFQGKRGSGTGPFRVAARGKIGVLLRPAFDPIRLREDDVEEPGPEKSVQLIGERASRAIVRFVDRQSDLVSGGTFVDWPLARAAEIAPANFRLDPAAGLFGLAVINRDGFLADAENRIALAQAIDRDALIAAFAAGWIATSQLLPEQLDSASPPVTPGWANLPPDERRAGARNRVRRWRDRHDGPLTIRIALPSGPGATILFGFVGAAFRSIGIEARRVAMNADADLRLIDRVAPYDSGYWYLATACQRCSPVVQAALTAVRDATDLPTRATAIADADAALDQDAAFIPIARPLRWSLVALRLRQWQGNARAWHPLDRLRDEDQ